MIFSARSGLLAGQCYLLKIENHPGITPDHFWVLVSKRLTGSLGSVESGVAKFSLRAWLILDRTQSYQQYSREVTLIAAEANPYTKTIYVQDGIFVDYVRGLRVGTYCMNALVEWMLSEYPDYTVYFPKLGGDLTADNVTRRNKLYQRFGFGFEWETINSIECAGGKARPCLARDLHSYRVWPNIKEYGIREGLSILLSENYHLAFDVKKLQCNVETLSKESRDYWDSVMRVVGYVDWAWVFLVFGMGLLAGYLLWK